MKGGVTGSAPALGRCPGTSPPWSLQQLAFSGWGHIYFLKPNLPFTTSVYISPVDLHCPPSSLTCPLLLKWPPGHWKSSWAQPVPAAGRSVFVGAAPRACPLLWGQRGVRSLRFRISSGQDLPAQLSMWRSQLPAFHVCRLCSDSPLTPRCTRPRGSLNCE